MQHTIMARTAFKRWWTRIVGVTLERTIFVAITCAILIGMVVCWRPLPGTVWLVEGIGTLAASISAPTATKEGNVVGTWLR